MAAPKKDKPKETAREKFVRLGNKRGNKVLESVRMLGGLAAPTYEYTPADVDAIFAAIRTAVDGAEKKFRQPTTRGKVPAVTLIGG